MEKFDFYKDWYDKEEERKISLEGSLNIPIGILTVVFAMQFYLIKDFDFENSSRLESILLFGLVGISTISALITTYYLFKSYHNIFKGFKYKGLPYPTQLLKYEGELIEYYNLNKDYYSGITGKEKFKEYLTLKLAELVDRNAFNNDIKSKSLHSSKRYIFISILMLVLAFVPFFHNSIRKPDRPQKIEILKDTSIEYRLKTIDERIKKLEKK